MGCYGLGGSLHDAVALVEILGAGTVLGFGAGQLASSDVLAPTEQGLSRAELAAAASLGRPRYFLSFANAGLPEDLAPVAGAIEHLAAATGVGFMAVCLAAPARGRTIYQGHWFEAGRLRGDLSRAFSLVMDGAVGVVSHETVAAGGAAIIAQCGRLKEQGKVLAVIDAISDEGCAVVAEALAAMPLAGGVAGFAAEAAAWPADAAAGPVAILSGARDRQTIFQIGAARAAMAVHDLDFSQPAPADAALAWAAARSGEAAFIITSSVPPDQLTQGAPAAEILADVARGLAAAGIRRFVVAGGETARAVCAGLNLTALSATGVSGPFFWLQNEKLSISFKSPGMGGKNLFLSEFRPHLSLNNIAEMAS